ncbi:MAG: hypothetical protein K2K80_06550 [Clostridia bacterium]|nr:hypothetical protein [Clostridia bacterium]
MKINNLKLSSKMHLLVIISCIVIAIGLAVGTVCQFISNGFFNYSADYETYKTVTVEYEDIDFSGAGREPSKLIEDICEKAFKAENLSKINLTTGDTNTGGKLIYKFSNSTDYGKLNSAVSAINDEIKEEVSQAGGIQFSYASAHEEVAVIGGDLVLVRAAIVAATIIVVHFIYFVIRYKLTMALGALLADMHNLALYLALVALCRVPVGSAIATYAVIAVIMSAIGTSYFFDKMRGNIKDEENKKLTAFELADKSANESLKFNVIMPACLAAVSVVVFVLMAISSLSPLAVISPVICSIMSFISCAYGTAIFVPSVYPRFKVIGDNTKEKSKAKRLAK